MGSSTEQAPHLPNPDRLIALIDGVYAVALTLLILDLRLPPEENNLSRALLLT
jgi:uncharacterized membrane protein